MLNFYQYKYFSNEEKGLEDMQYWSKKRKNIVIVPLGFLFDDPLLFSEIEKKTTCLENQGFDVYFCPSLSSNIEWPKLAAEILKEKNFVNNQMLIYPFVHQKQ